MFKSVVQVRKAPCKSESEQQPSENTGINAVLKKNEQQTKTIRVIAHVKSCNYSLYG